jgi:hypothetical protein
VESIDDRAAVQIDPDVLAVVEFMQERIAASRLVAVADGLAAVAPLLWSRHQPEVVEVLKLAFPPISGCGPRIRSSSNE